MPLGDALVTIAAAARAGALLGAERLRLSARARPAADGVPRADWLTSVLRPHFPGVHVRAIEPLNSDAGTTERIRIAVAYDDCGRGDPPPATLFLKLAPADLKTRLFANLMELGATEVRFYAEIAAGAPLPAPRAYHAVTRGGARDFVLVLEDLAARGARFTNVAQRLGLADAYAVMSALARLHAAFWESRRFAGDLAWLKSHGRNPRYRVERFVCAAAVPAALERFGDLIAPELRAAAPLVVRGRDRLEAAWARGPLTLVHGDAHAGNVFFLNGSPPSAGLFDWQVAQRGQAMRDVAYFLVGSVPTDLRRAHERELIAAHAAALADLGVPELDPDEAWRQYRLHALYAWIAAVVTAAAATLQAEQIVRAAIARTSTAVMDLDSLGALHVLGC